MNTSDIAPLRPIQGEHVPFDAHWHIRKFDTAEGTHYEVRDSRGEVVAGNIKCLEHARLFALSPSLLSEFERLTSEAQRVLHFMVDEQEGSLDLREVAEDVNGQWGSVSDGAPEFAQWLLDIEDLRATIGPQSTVEGVARQAELDLDHED